MDSPLDDEWIKIKRPAQGHDTLSWTVSLSRTRVSTVDGLRFSKSLDTGMIENLGSLLTAVQSMKLKQFPADRIEAIRTVGVGETFSVSESKFDGDVIAVKHIRLHEDMANANRTAFQRRLQAVLREIRIMHHPPLAHHPNIVSLLGYGWVFEEQRLVPFITVELARGGSLRNYLKETERPFKAKKILAGDIAAGLMALHKCSIVHGDLKIDNVLVVPSLDRPSGAVAKVSDFGHSIIPSPESEATAHYFGTELYNAPEVRHQRSQPIPVEQLHKCDIWAFGLCVWEILADGQIYFQKSWAENSAYCRPSLSPTSSMSSGILLELDNKPAPEADNEHTFDRFDPCHLQGLAQSFVQGIGSPEIWFERKILLALFKHTLQIDPCQRLSDLTRLPVMNTWKKAAGGSFLQSELASLAMTSEMKYSIFTGHNSMHIPWAHQQILLHDLETEAARDHPSLSATEAAFHTMLCYINAFGTPRDHDKAAVFLRQASSARHVLTQTFGPQIESGLLQKGESSGPSYNYAESLAFGFRITSQFSASSSVDVHFGPAILNYPDYMSFKNGLVDLQSTYAEYGDITAATVRNHRRQVRYSIFEFAIRHNDLKLLEDMLSTAPERSPGMNISKESLLHTAARCGNLDIVELLMRYWSSTESFDTSVPLYWLFCFSGTQIDRLVQLLQEVCRDNFKEGALDRSMPAAEETPLHSQWPFKVQGTPLAIAVSSGNIAAVKALLQLGANPLIPAFSPNEDQEHLLADLTPLHMAVKYNFPGIFDLLWHSAFPSRCITMEIVCSNQHLRSLPLACALSPLTSAERLAIHGRSYLHSLRETVSSISPIVQQQDPDGRTAVSQAIDMEDIDALEALLTNCPELARMKIKHGSLYTYPLHLATQAFSNRESEELRKIILYLLRLDPTAVDRPDASSFKPIHIAAMGSSTSLLELLLDRGASLDSTDELGRTALHACKTDTMVQLLHSRGASLNQRDLTGMTPVHVAANKGNGDVVRSLIQHGAEVNLTDDEGNTALHFATKARHPRAAKDLLEAGACVDAQDSHRQTALHIALNSGQYDLAHILFEHRANPFSLDLSEFSPFLIALTSNHASVLKEVLNHPAIHSLSHASLIEALFHAAAYGEPATLAVYLQFLYPMLSKNEEIDHIDAAVAVHHAAEAGRVDLVQVLLSHGFNLESLDSEGNTPLISACKGNRIQPTSNARSEKRNSMCEYLLRRGANILAEDKHHQTPFSVAHQYQDLPLMTLLLDHAVEANKQTPYSHLQSLLHYVLADSKEPPPTLPRQNTIKLFDDKTIGKELFDTALDNENWHLATNLFAGKFVEDLHADSIHLPRKSHSDDSPTIHHEITRQVESAVCHFYAERKDWEMIAHIYRSKPTISTLSQFYQYPNRRQLHEEYGGTKFEVFRFLKTEFGYERSMQNETRPTIPPLSPHST